MMFMVIIDRGDYMISEKFNTRISNYEKERDSLKKSLDLISTTRLISFVLILYLGYRYVRSGYSDLLFFLTLIGIIVFIVLVIYHNKVKDKFNFNKGLIKINNKYLDRINGNWINFSDFGEDFMDKNHRYSYDLDIVGPNSLFQRINLSSSLIGRKTLANDLLNPKYNKNEILNRQEAIKELGSKLDFVQYLEYESSKKTKMKDPEEVISFFEANVKARYSHNFKLAINIISIIFLIVSSLTLFFQTKPLYILLFGIISFQIVLWLINRKRNTEALDKVGLFKNNLEVYLNLLKIIEKEDFTSAELENLKSNLFSGEGAIKAIEKLDTISEMINLKHSGVLYLLLNIFFLWDHRSIYALEKWNEEYATNIKNWIYSLGKFESLSSLSVLLQIESNISYPIIRDDLNIKSKFCGHPLLEVEERIYNNINIDNNILVITGSNMSGKTTFLRTIGINLVLLNAGTVTISEEFISPIINIYTSMRITDDLKNKISTFYAELLRIKKILDYTKKNKNTIFLIDEIFTGTNSKDRVLGAKNVLKNLNKLGLVGAITTHDFELCELDKYPRIENYHFAEDYVDGKISFDYKIKKGRSQSTNARYLMELVGIDIID